MKNITLRVLIALAAMILMVSAFTACCCTDLPFLNQGPDFQKIYDNLDSDVQFAWDVGSDGSYLKGDSNRYDLEDYSNWDVMNSIEQVNKELGLPDSLYSDMLGTSWSMGKQTETFESAGVTVSWTYHPDQGLEVTYKKIN